MIVSEEQKKIVRLQELSSCLHQLGYPLKLFKNACEKTYYDVPRLEQKEILPLVSTYHPFASRNLSLIINNLKDQFRQIFPMQSISNAYRTSQKIGEPRHSISNEKIRKCSSDKCTCCKIVIQKDYISLNRNVILYPASFAYKKILNCESACVMYLKVKSSSEYLGINFCQGKLKEVDDLDYLLIQNVQIYPLVQMKPSDGTYVQENMMKILHNIIVEHSI